MNRIEAITAQITELAASPAPNPDELELLLRELKEAEAEHLLALNAIVDRAGSREGAGKPAPRAARRTAGDAAIPVRERVLAALELLGVPSRGTLVSVAAVARTGLDV